MGRRVTVHRIVGTALAIVAVGGAVAATPAQAAGDTTPPAPFDIVADAGEYQTGWSVASPYSNIYVTWQVTTDESSAVRYEVAVDGLLQRTVDDAAYTTVTRRVEVPEGQHTVAVTAVDAAGNRRSATHVLDVVVDKVSPVFTSFPLLLLRTGRVTDAGYPMRFTWSGTDEGTGLALGRIGPNESCCYTFDPMLERYDFTVAPRSSTAWRIWLYDGVGRVTRTGRDGYVDAVPWSETRRSDGWRKSRDAKALDGSEWRSKTRGARFRLAVTGRSVAWVASRGPDRGRADVLVNGRVVDTVSLRSASVQPARVVWAAKIPNGEVTVVTVVNRSRAQRPTVGVDAFLLQR